MQLVQSAKVKIYEAKCFQTAAFLLVNTMNCSRCLLTLLMAEAQEMLHTECSIFYFLNDKAIQSKLVVSQSRPHEY